MIELQAPNRRELWHCMESVFLAGSIEMGKAENWQVRFMDAIDRFDYLVMNPRRDDWNPNWEQRMDNPLFAEQVNWELDHIKAADNVVFYFDPNTMSPITLMELGYIAGLPSVRGWRQVREVIVCCPPGFWRKGNVDIICKRAGFKVVETLDELIEEFTRVEE